jgi:transcriptional regulator with XRE-family HTH domain
MDKKQYLEQFGLNIRQIRTAKSISQEELAFNAGMDRTYLSGIERGLRNPSLYNIYRLSKSLNIPTSELFNFNVEIF